MTKQQLVAEVVEVSDRFAKSANVERDFERGVFDTYRLTSRSADVLLQITEGILDPTAGRAFSITGPYGTGKSSFAIFLGALLAPQKSKLFEAAITKLNQEDPELGKAWIKARAAVGMTQNDAAIGFVTAKAEPVSATLARAIQKFTTAKDTLQDLIQTIRELASQRPVFILLDEFGKNLENFSTSQAAGDPFILQELAEASQGDNALPIFLITMQHLAFDEYVTDASFSSRREWAKIQGRFHDISFVETSLQSQALVASALSVTDFDFKRRLNKWFSEFGQFFDQITDLQIASNSYPLHPVALAALPELCNRYGQNERTLFSFIAGSEAGAMPSLLTEIKISPSDQIPFIDLENLYNYFVANASSFIGVSSSASKWLEIETRIRDTVDLESIEVKILKSVAVLNLVSTGGTLRASKDLITQMLVTLGFTSQAVESALSALVKKNLLTYREFSDEWRIWQGSDFDVRSAIELARTRALRQNTADLLSSHSELQSLIAGRSSQEKGILRIFGQTIATDGLNLDDIDPKDAQEFDGIVLLLTDSIPVERPYAGTKPLIEVHARHPERLRERALDVASAQGALEDLRSKKDDWVAQRELLERLTLAQLALRVEMQNQWDPRDSTLIWRNAPKGFKAKPARNFSEYLSQVCSTAYTSAPRVRNEMIARRELSSQGAKARREIAEALLEKRTLKSLGFQGFGPEKSMYDAVFLSTGIHKQARDEKWELSDPTDPGWAKIWDYLGEATAPGQRVNLSQIGQGLKQAPFGLKSGLLWLVVFSYLVANENDLAIYENDSLILALDDAIAERLLKNPSFFSVRRTGVNAGLRKDLVSALAVRFGLRAGVEATFMTVVRALFRNLQQLPPYTLKTSTHLPPEAIKIRALFEKAKEPDVLLFEALPASLGFPPILAQKSSEEYEGKIEKLVDAIYVQFYELDKAYTDLLQRITDSLASGFGAPSELDSLRVHLTELSGHLPKTSTADFIATFKFAMEREFTDNRSWLENLAMVVLGGYPPRQWADSNEIEFTQSVAVAATKVKDLEKLTFANSSQSPSRRLVTLTSPDGSTTAEMIDVDGISQSISADIDKIIQTTPNLKNLSKRELAVLLMSLAAQKLESN